VTCHFGSWSPVFPLYAKHLISSLHATRTHPTPAEASFHCSLAHLRFQIARDGSPGGKVQDANNSHLRSLREYNTILVIPSIRANFGIQNGQLTAESGHNWIYQQTTRLFHNYRCQRLSQPRRANIDGRMHCLCLPADLIRNHIKPIKESQL
jgi:hypothetical protein